MSYNYNTQWDSPNYTPASATRTAWGVNRHIKEIAIHWWDHPSKNPSFEGVVGGFLRAGGLSAHYVATGTDRRVACLVSPLDNSWATGPGNPYTISIECDPRCRDEDYDLVAELIADIRSAYGDLTLVGHNKYVNTACPGTYDLGRLDREARNKFSHPTDWGKGGTITPPQPKVTSGQIAAAYLEVLERPYDEGGMQAYLGSGFDIERIKNELRNSTEYKNLQARKAVDAQAALDKAKKEADEQSKRDQERAERDRASLAAEAAAKEAAATAKQNQSTLNQILEIVRQIVAKLTGIFK